MLVVLCVWIILKCEGKGICIKCDCLEGGKYDLIDKINIVIV